MGSKWQFRKIRKGDTASDPNFARTLFSMDVARSLVRESIQNSLDARASGSASIEVRFALRSGHLAAEASDAAPFLHGLWEHVHAESAGLDRPPNPSERIPYLVVEDFRTRGLTGDPEAWSPFESEKNGFYLFFRALGRSGKKNEERGRWGVGKFVFPLASRAHTLFGYTVQADTEVSLLMGRTVLKVHKTNEMPYHPDGHWGSRDSEDELVLAETDADVLETFREVFNLQRTEEPGLSVVVPWLSVMLTGAAITEAVVTEYFLPILRSELTVEIDENGALKTIGADTIVKVAEGISSPDLRAKISLAVEAATWPSNTIYELPTLELSGETDWAELLQADTKAALLNTLEEGKPIALRVPMFVRPRDKSPKRSWFDVFIQRVDGIGRQRPLIVREGITIPEEKTQSVHDHVALIVIDHGPLAGFVGDAETPAHTTLQYDLVAPNYTLAGKALKIIRISASEIVRSLEEASETDDFSLLADFFPVAAEEEQARRRTPTQGRGEDPPPPPPPIPKTTPRYRVSQTDGGFRVYGTEEGELPSLLTIRFAYQVRRGNPLKRYNPFDFSLLRRGDLKVEADGAAIVDKAHNVLMVAPAVPGFRIDISGFDPNRDLIVRVDAQSGDNAQ